MDRQRPETWNRRVRALAAGILMLVVLAAPVALAPSAAVGAPSAVDEYKLDLPGGGATANGGSKAGSDQGSSDSGGAVIPIAIGAGLLTVIAVALLARNRRREI